MLDLALNIGEDILSFKVSVAKRHGYMKLNNTLKALAVENPKLTIGDLLIKHEQTPMRPVTFNLIKDAILNIGASKANNSMERDDYDKLVSELADLDQRFEKNQSVKVKKGLKERVKSTRPKNPPVKRNTPTLGDLIKAELARNS